jgi:two-component system NtrC family sensor kinase
MLREEAEAAGSDPVILGRVEKIEAAAERCARVVRSFLTIARQRKAETRAVALAPLLDSSIELMLYGLRSSGVTVTRDYDETLPKILADPDQVQQIVVNLLVNAAQALEETEGRREIRVSVRAARDGKLGVVFADSGPGVPKDIAKRIFEPFFTTKPQGHGTGIGLSVSRGLAEAQGGTLALLTSPKGGAVFELSLPLAAGKSEAKAGKRVDRANGSARDRRAKGNGREPRAIVVDDEPEIAVLLAEALRKAGYVCDVATGGREGQAMIAAHPGSYDALVCDLRMPDIDGPKLFRWISDHHPGLAERTLFVTGDALGPTAGRFLEKSGRPVLEKPFAPADVVRVIAGFPPRAP